MATVSASAMSSGCTQINPGSGVTRVGPVSLPFPVGFSGHLYNQLFISSQGYAYFGRVWSDDPMNTFVPVNWRSVWQADKIPTIAPFMEWGSGSDPSGGGVMSYGTTTFNGFPAFCMQWQGWANCDYFLSSAPCDWNWSDTNDFQALLVERNDVGPGDFDIVFNYGQIRWDQQCDTADSAPYGVDCAAESNDDAAVAGWKGYGGSGGVTMPTPFDAGAYLDVNSTGLIHGSVGSSTAGQYIWPVRNEQTIAPYETWGGGNPAEHYCHVCDGDPVDTATGDYSEATTDLAIGGRGPGLRMTRTYSSLAAASGVSSPLGPGWAMPYGMSLAVDSSTGNATVTNSDGSRTVFNPDGSGGFTAPGRVLATLLHNSDGTYTYTVRARTIYTFSSAGKLTAVADLNGNKIALAYNSAGQLATATDGDSRSLTFSYDSNGELASVKDSTGRTVLYGHDAAGDLTSVTDVRGGIWRYTYDANHLLLTRQDANGNTVMTNTYDPSGRTLTQTDALQNKTTFSYSGDPSTATQVTNPRGYVTEYDYSNGILTKVIGAVGTSQAATWTYQHDPLTLGVAQVTDPNGHVATATYDSQGNQTSTTDGLGNQTSSTYDSLNDMTAHTDANGVTTTYTYNTRGDMLTKSTPLVGTSQTQTYTYTYGNTSHPGDLTAVKDPDGKTTGYSYDAAGDVASVTDPANEKTAYTYDAVGRRLTMVDPRNYKTSYTYDAAGDLLSTTDPLGHKTTRTYDADGNLSTVTDADGNTTSYTYNANNQVVKVTRADGTTLQTGYNPDGGVDSQTDGAGNTTSYKYDALDHKSSSTDALNRTTGYSYDAVGNLLSTTDPQGRTTTYGYNVANELTGITYSDLTTPNVTFGYDNDGRRTSMSDGTGKSTYTFDSLGRLTKTVDGAGNTVLFGYDLAGNQTSITYPNGKTVTNTLDTAERLASITDWLGNKTSFTYDADSDLSKTTFPKNSDAYTYNNADQLTKIAITASTSASLTYSRDANGQVATDVPSGLPGTSQTYAYNKLNQLTQATTAGSYAYNAADEPTALAGASGYNYDAANQLANGPSASYTYDSLGERTAQTPVSGTATTYNYDQAGRLTSATNSAGTTTYSYDGDGLRATKSGGGARSTYAWGHSGPLPVLLGDGSASYIYGPQGLPIEQITSSGAISYYHHDQLGSTRMLTNSAGTVTGTFTYDPYGRLTGSTGSTTTPLGFAGQYTDPETGLIYLRSRYYDPQTGQFITRDPLEALTRQAYLYIGNDPLNGADPSGEAYSWWQKVVAGIAAIGIAIGSQNPDVEKRNPDAGAEQPGTEPPPRQPPTGQAGGNPPGGGTGTGGPNGDGSDGEKGGGEDSSEQSDSTATPICPRLLEQLLATPPFEPGAPPTIEPPIITILPHPITEPGPLILPQPIAEPFTNTVS